MVFGHKGQHLTKRFRLIVGGIVVRNEIGKGPFVFQYQLFDAQAFGQTTQTNDAYQLFSLLGNATETVFEAGNECLDFALFLHAVQFAVKRDALGVIRDVLIREEQFHIRLNHRVGDKETFLAVALLFGFHLLIEVAELFVFKLRNCLLKDFLVRFISQISDEAALFSPEHISCPADVEVLHGDVDAAA